MNLALEITAVILNVTYLVLLIRENIACWFFGISGSIVSIYLFYKIGLYSEAILYIYYIIIGIYGYRIWKKKTNVLRIKAIGNKQHIMWIAIGILSATALGSFFKNYTDASNPYLDAFTTIFSFIASYLEARKIISAWIFWILINAFTIILYLQQDLTIYVALTIVYVIFSIIGYREWYKKITKQRTLVSYSNNEEDQTPHQKL